MAEKTYDRGTQDVGNVLALEHVNVTVPDPELAALFYVVGPRLHPRPLHRLRRPPTCGSTSARSSSTCPRATRRCCGARSASCVPDLEQLKAAPGPLRAALRRPPGGHGLRVHRGRRRHAADHLPVGQPVPGARGRATPSAASASACPTSTSTSPPGAADGIARFYDEVIGAPASRHRGRRRAPRRGAGWPGAAPPLHRDRRRAPGLRRPPHRRVPGQLLQALPGAAPNGAS